VSWKLAIEKEMREDLNDQSRGDTLCLSEVEGHGSGLCRMANGYIFQTRHCKLTVYM